MNGAVLNFGKVSNFGEVENEFIYMFSKNYFR